MRAQRMLAAASVAVAALAAPAFAANDITGAGSTFAYPIYSKWAEAYKEKTGVGLNYQSIGSGGGIKQIIAKTVDFGASDMPLTVEDLKKDGLQQFPTCIGGAIPTVNLKGVKPGELRLTGAVLGDIYLGKVKKWNDAAVRQLNPHVNLPDTAITVVHRSDGSGTTYIWSDYLSKVSPEWQSKVGKGTSINWPTGVGGKGNEGVASYVQRINGAIGYVEYAYVLQNHMTYAVMQNKEGEYVSPNAQSFQAAAAGADWSKAPGMNLMLTDAPGRGAWPIAGATFILVHTASDNPAQEKQLLEFFQWAYANGGRIAESLDYVPMPASVAKLIESNWKEIKDSSGKPVI
ncbi:MAG TPA: phosphate ABC transporter substrate-binding protein PstS [Usitatibacter sp.]|nr:phosphate ABC transporter substrate-binding protein PstS [Usitatibacter sp.]